VEKIKKILSGRKFTYYMTTSLMVVAVIGILVVINLLLEKKDIKWDVTLDKKYSISEQTKKYISTDLNTDIKIIVFKTVAQGEFQDYYTNILNEYKNLSPKIKVEEFDPDKFPVLVKKYQIESEEPIIIVEAGNKYRKISVGEVYNEYFSSESASLETKLTGAINYVSMDSEKKGYIIKGHSGLGLSDLRTAISRIEEDSGIEVEEVDLATKQSVPTDASLIILAGQRSDLSDDEREKIDKYLKANGKMIVFLGRFDETPVAKFKNLSAILKDYNIEIQDNIICESSESNFFAGRISFLIPNLEFDPITTPIIDSGLRFSMPETRSIKILSEKIDGLTVTSLAKTSDKSWGETSLERASKDEGELTGPLDIIVKAEKTGSENMSSRVIVYGNFLNIYDKYVQESGSAGNVELFVTGTKWLVDNKETMNILPKSIKNENVSYTSTQSIIIIITVLLIPVLFIIGGISVWVVRKKL
jgi:hypothetical protein